MKNILAVALLLGVLSFGGFSSVFENAKCPSPSVSHNTDCSGGKISPAFAGLGSVAVPFLVAPPLFFLGFFVGRATTRSLSLRETGPPVFV